jgi:SAM-dependent methyltransferase
MAVACPIELDTVRLRNELQSIYARVASEPDGEFHFHRGREYAERFLRYEPLALARVPPLAVESFAGVGNPLRMEPTAAGATVVDIGCGSGTDLLLAASAVGPRGRAIGVDMTDAMLRKAEAAAAEAGLANVELRRGDALDLPIEHRGRGGAAGSRPAGHRPVVRLNRRRSAGGSAAKRQGPRARSDQDPS